METQYHCAHIHTHIYIYRLSSLKLTGLSNTSWGLKQTTLNMKLYLILAFVAFTGCQANLFYADEPKPLLEQLTNAFWSYVAQATRTTEDTLKMIRESQLGQEVNVRMTQSADIASEYAVTLKEQMDPMLEELRSKITKETEVFMELLSQNLIGIRDKLKPYSDNLKRQIQETVKKFIDAVGSFTP
ncbi:apolipoprotein Eb-like isoform X2 [Labeo rohita]|uniref:apolipoprotein Eb-like isoform X2 n=1 Tax=Labeo rohita TaxID=84645 RepID=UPI0021E2FD7C|nr:apolipoprotein Eb-like isoform X2 [Labeo rohita]